MLKMIEPVRSYETWMARPPRKLRATSDMRAEALRSRDVLKKAPSNHNHCIINTTLRGSGRTYLLADTNAATHFFKRQVLLNTFFLLRISANANQHASFGSWYDLVEVGSASITPGFLSSCRGYSRIWEGIQPVVNRPFFSFLWEERVSYQGYIIIATRNSAVLLPVGESPTLLQSHFQGKAAFVEIHQVYLLETNGDRPELVEKTLAISLDQILNWVDIISSIFRLRIHIFFKRGSFIRNSSVEISICKLI